MGWLETGEAVVFPCSLQESRVGSAVFTPDTPTELGDSGKINKKMHKTRAASACNVLLSLLSDKGGNELLRRETHQRSPVQKGLYRSCKPDQSTECL